MSVGTDSDREIDPSNFGPTQRQIVEALLEADGGVRIAELEEFVDRASYRAVKSSLRKLRDRGIVTADPVDGRNWLEYSLVEDTEARA